MKINWKLIPRATALNLARQSLLLQDRLMPESPANELLQKCREPAEILNLTAHNLSPHDPWEAWIDLIGLAAQFQNAQSIANEWISGFSNHDSTMNETLSGAIRQLEAIVLQDQPQLEVQLQYRMNPLQQQWDGFGNAIFAHLHRLTKTPRNTAAIDLLMVSPIINGDGFVCQKRNVVVMEALFVNPISALPEVLRLSWLAAQLAFNRLGTSEVELQRFQEVNALALLPAILAAGEVIELTRCEESNLRLALMEFAPRQPNIDSIERMLLHWWETFLQTKPNWNVALAALERTLKG